MTCGNVVYTPYPDVAICCVLSHKYFSNASMGRKISGNHDVIFIYGVCTESRIVKEIVARVVTVMV